MEKSSGSSSIAITRCSNHENENRIVPPPLARGRLSFVRYRGSPGPDQTDSGNREEGRPVRLDGGRSALLDSRGAVPQLQRLAGHAAQGLAGHREAARQHLGDPCLLGTVRTGTGKVRYFGGRSEEHTSELQSL